MTNTPMGRQNAMPPSQMAAQIAQKLKDPPPAGTTEILSDTAFSAARPQDLSEVYAR
jgi:hypothetical protein